MSKKVNRNCKGEVILNIKDTEEYKSSIKLLNKITMNKEFVPYEEALVLKELGFDEQCLALYDLDGNITIEFVNWENAINTKDNYLISAPLYQQTFRWFREKYKLSCSIELTDNSRHYYFDFTIYDSKDRDWNDEDCFDSCKRLYSDGEYSTYEEAELECLKKLIGIVKTK